MPLILILLAIMLIDVGILGTQKDLATQLKSDFEGSNNFFIWIVAIGIAGSFGYLKPLKGVSNAMLVLIILAMFLTNGRNGFFQMFASAIKGGGSTSPVGGNVAGTSGTSPQTGSSSNILQGLTGGQGINPSSIPFETLPPLPANLQ